MLRRCSTRLAASAAAAVAGSSSTNTPARHPYEDEFEAYRADDTSVLGGANFNFHMECIEQYRDLQARYAVKQSEMERTRRAANVCGLEVTKPGARKDTSKK